jgi:DeoR/GlpR family transcriptional regulator of sugar metabolism
MRPTPIPAERRTRICEGASSLGTVKVAELGQRFGVSEITIRRDLVRVERDGALKHIYGGVGGAVSSRMIRQEPLRSPQDQLASDP